MEGSGMVTRCNQEAVTLAGFGGIEKSIMAPPGALNDPRIALNQGAQRESPWLICDISLFTYCCLLWCLMFGLGILALVPNPTGAHMFLKQTAGVLFLFQCRIETGCPSCMVVCPGMANILYPKQDGVLLFNYLLVLNVGNGAIEWGNGMIVRSYCRSFPHSLLSTSKIIESKLVKFMGCCFRRQGVLLMNMSGNIPVQWIYNSHMGVGGCSIAVSVQWTILNIIHKLIKTYIVNHSDISWYIKHDSPNGYIYR